MKGKQYKQDNHLHNYRLLKIYQDDNKETIVCFYCTRCLVYDMKRSDYPNKISIRRALKEEDAKQKLHQRTKKGI